MGAINKHITQEYADNNLAKKTDIEQIKTSMGDIETALDSIIEIQNELIGGESV